MCGAPSRVYVTRSTRALSAGLPTGFHSVYKPGEFLLSIVNLLHDESK